MGPQRFPEIISFRRRTQGSDRPLGGRTSGRHCYRCPQLPAQSAIPLRIASKRCTSIHVTHVRYVSSDWSLQVDLHGETRGLRIDQIKGRRVPRPHPHRCESHLAAVGQVQLPFRSRDELLWGFPFRYFGPALCARSLQADEKILLHLLFPRPQPRG